MAAHFSVFNTVTTERNGFQPLCNKLDQGLSIRSGFAPSYHSHCLKIVLRVVNVEQAYNLIYNIKDVSRPPRMPIFPLKPFQLF